MLFAPPKVRELPVRQRTENWSIEAIWRRPKRPYRAPIHRSFFNGATTPEYLPDLLSPRSVRETGLFNSPAVSALVSKLQRGAPIGETDEMGLVGIISGQLVAKQFVSGFHAPLPVGEADKIKVCFGKQIVQSQ